MTASFARHALLHAIGLVEFEMQYMMLVVMLVAVSSIGWFVHSRNVNADKARTRKTQAAQKVRLARLQPAEESSDRSKPKDKRRKFGNR